MTKATVKPALKRIEDKIDQLMKVHEISPSDEQTIDPTEGLEHKCECGSMEEESSDQSNQSENGENHDVE